MHERRTLMVRNPGRPTMERLPCRLSRDEKLAKMDRTDALERSIEEVEGQVLALRAKAKADVDALQERLGELNKERRQCRNARLNGYEERLVECELLEDAAEGMLYVFRLDTREVAQRRDMAPHEQREIQLEGRETRTVDIPEDVGTVTRFDSDPPGATDEKKEDEDEKKEEAKPEGVNGKHYGHEHEFNEGSCITCNAADPDFEKPAEAAKPVRRKKGEKAPKQEGTGSAKKKRGAGRGYDTRTAGTH